MLRNCLSALLNSLSFNYSEEKDSRKIKRQKIVSRSRTLRFEPCEDRTMLSVSPFNSEDVTAHWTFDVNTEDTNGAFIGTLNNGASLTTNGIAGGGLSLDGVDDYFSIGDPEELQIINEITLSAWIIPESASGTQNIIAKGYSTHPNGEIFLRIANGKYQVGSWTGSNHMAEFAIPSSDIGERVHLAGTYDGTTWRLYRNGVEIASTVDNIGAVEVDGAWAVGARGTGTERFYSGVIDEVIISSTAYTAQEIAELASIPTNAQEDNSVTWNWSDVQSGELYSEQGDSLGTLSNGAVVQFDSAYGQVLNLSGNNGYVSLGNPDDLQIHGQITLSAWICPNSFTGIQNIIAKGHTTNPKREIALRINNGQYQVGSWDGSNHYASVAADAEDIGQWILLTGVYDGTTWQLYKNGVLAASLPSTVGAVPVSADWSIGSNSNGADRFFNGKIGNGGIYDHALDAQSVAALITDSQTTARVGGNPYAIKDQSYVLQLDASNPDVLWTVNWGDGTTEEYYNVSSVSHVYTHYGTSGVSVTAKRNGQTIDVAGSSISLQIGSVDEMIINGNFEDVAIPNGTYWAVYNSISGWTGQIEIQEKNGSKIAELDTDNRTSGLDTTPSDHLTHHTTITSYQMDFTPGLTYTLSFDAWNRSDYAQDNILNVTVPGEIISVNGNTSVAALLDLIDDNDLGAYSYTSISYNSVTFSAGGSYYETDDGNGGTVYTLGASPFHVSSITFVATSNSGFVSFSDVSSDVVPCYGPLLDNISMNQEYLYVDIDVDSNNDGVINGFDDAVEIGNSQSASIESGAYGFIVLAGEQFSVNLNTISSRLLDSSIYGVRLLDSEGILDFTFPSLHQSTATITAEQAGQTTLAYEIYLLGTNQVVARDEVLITVNTPPHLRAYKDDSVICETEGYETGDYSTVAEIFHDANDNQSITTIDLNSYFHDKETPDELLYSIYSSGNSEIVSLTLSDSILDIQFTDTVGQTSITVQATDPLGACETWTIDLYNVRIIGYEIQEKAFSLPWDEVEDKSDNWSLHWQENKYQWTPILENNVGKDRVTAISWYAVDWGYQQTWLIGSVFAMATWNSNGNQTHSQFLTENWSIEEGTNANVLADGEYAIVPKLTFNSIEDALLSNSVIAELNWKGDNYAATQNKPRVGKVGIERVEWVQKDILMSDAYCEMKDNPPENGGGKRIYPEKPSATDNLQNQIGVQVILTDYVPDGMTGHVTLELLDPMNQCKDYAGNLVSDEINDNNGSALLAVSSTPYDPSSGLTSPPQIKFLRTVVNERTNISEKRYVNITQANAGDNYIVAAHPYSDADSFMVIDSSSVAKDQAVYNVNGSTTIAKQTDLLTIWRTLWVERDQLTLSSGGAAADLPLIDGFVQSEFALTCIDIQEYTHNTNRSTIGPQTLQENWSSLNPFIYTPKSCASACRNSPKPTDSFWTVHMIGAFFIENYNALGINYTNDNTIFIFNSQIETSYSTSWVSCKRELSLHELGHTFDLVDIDKGDTSNINYNTVMWQGNLLVNQHFSTNQIKTIQTQSKPQ